MITMNIHNVQAIHVDHTEVKTGTAWYTFTFYDEDGRKTEVIAFTPLIKIEGAEFLNFVAAASEAS